MYAAEIKNLITEFNKNNPAQFLLYLERNHKTDLWVEKGIVLNEQLLSENCILRTIAKVIGFYRPDKKVQTEPGLEWFYNEITMKLNSILNDSK